MRAFRILPLPSPVLHNRAGAGGIRINPLVACRSQIVTMSPPSRVCVKSRWDLQLAGGTACPTTANQAITERWDRRFRLSNDFSHRLLRGGQALYFFWTVTTRDSVPVSSG